MRQVGIIAAAGIVALESMVERLADDHSTSQKLAQGLVKVSGIVLDPEKVQTNIVIFDWTGGPAPLFLERLADRGVKGSYVGGTKIRMVTHAGIGPREIDHALEVVETVARETLAVRP